MRLPFSPETEQRLLAGARAHPLRQPVRYPRWYLQRWHFLPDGYLSANGAAAYEFLIPRLYNVLNEASVLRTLGRAVAARAPRRVLELGCGPGHALAAVARAMPAAQITGVDLSPFQVERACTAVDGLGSRVTVRHASSLDLPFEDRSFDAVVAVHHFGHLPAGARALALTEATRVLGAGGRLFVVDHAWHGPLPIAGARSSQRLLGGLVRLDEIAPGVPIQQSLLVLQPGMA